MAQNPNSDPNLLMSIRVAGDHIEGYSRREIEWTERSIDVLVGMVLKERRFRDALFHEIVESIQFRDEMLTRINNRQTSLS
jgi:hypothetical protein